MKKLTSAVIDSNVLKKLHEYSPERQSDMWVNTGGNPRHFKDSLTDQLKIIQSRRCAYCGRHLLEDSPARDHIAPKESHPEFTFIPANLVLACYHCNTECKLATDTVLVNNAIYQNCTFSIIHPYFDEPGEHIQFIGGENKILVQVISNSSKGKTTVDLFHLASSELTKQRAKDAMFDTDLDHLPGNWQDAFRYIAQSPLQMKICSI
jgi:uncharacterized protein (TIGR02646 family)